MDCDVSKNENAWSNRVITIAQNYANYIWTPTDKNSYHGYDKDGILVNTPDSGYKGSKYDCGWWEVHKENRGIPYNWGGCSSIEEFTLGLEEGKFAGNVPDFRDNGISSNCVGVDCSGLVSACWLTKERLSTRSISGISTRLDSMDLLMPGDVILLPGSHVMIFISFTDEIKTAAHIVDASRSTGRVMQRIVQISELSAKGYAGYRKISNQE